MSDDEKKPSEASEPKGAPESGKANEPAKEPEAAKAAPEDKKEPEAAKVAAEDKKEPEAAKAAAEGKKETEAAKAKSTPPPAEAPAAAEPAKAKSEPPKAAEPPKKSTSHPPPAAAAAAKVAEPLTPAPGVRVRVAYANGSAVEVPADPKSRMKPRRLLAEYETTADVIHAAETLRDAGYKAFEAHSPFPIHGMDAAMGLPDSKLGWIVLACGLTGVTSAWVMMYWMNGVDYPLIIGGKPPGTLPSMVPIMFELTVLLSSFGAVLGMFGLNRLPQHHDVIFYSDRFAAFSNDKFFISVESTDPKFDVQKTRQLLERSKPECIEVIETIEEVGS